MLTVTFTRTARRAAAFLAALAFVGVLASAFFHVQGRAAGTTYYSRGSLPPEVFASWSTTRDGLGTPPLAFNGGDVFVIQNGHNMGTASTWTVTGTGSKVQIENGGTLTANNIIDLAPATTFRIDNGGTYVQNVAMAMTNNIFDGTEEFGPSSNFIYQVTPTGVTTPSSPGYGNLTFNMTTGGTAFNWSATVTNVQGNFTIQSTGSTAGVEQRLTSSENLTLTVGGNLSISGGTLVLTNGAGVPTINLGGGYNQTGGTLTVTGSGVGSINFDGGAFFVNFVKSGGTLNNANINWSIAAGKTVEFADAFTNAASRTFNVDAGGMLLAADAINNNGTLNVNGEFRITDGGGGTGAGFVYGPGGTLGFVTASPYAVNGDAYWPTTNGPVNVNVLSGLGISMNVARTVGGTFQYAAAVANAGNLTLNGTAQVNSGGFIDSGSPTYGPSSTLKYNTEFTYGRGGEWAPGATAGNAGCPANVRVSNNTTLDLPNGSNGSAFNMSGSLTIDSGSGLSLSPSTQPLNVKGGVTNSGTLTLSTAAGGGLNVGGNWANNGTFTHNNKTVAFDGADNTQTLSGTTSFYNLTVKHAGAGGVTASGGALAVTNLLRVESGTFTGAGTFKGVQVDSGATLAAAGNFTVGGDWTNAGTFSAGAFTVTFGGGSQQQYTQTGSGGFGGLTLNNSAGLLLNNSLSVDGTLTLASGNISAGTNTVNVGPNASVSRTSGHVVGNVQKSFAAAGAHAFTYPVGTANGYSPVDASVTVGSAGANTLAVKAVQGKQPNLSGANALGRYWTLSSSFAGAGSADLTFNYLAGDVVGTESNYKLVRVTSAGAVSQFTPDALDTASHKATLNGVTSFSDWTLAEPSAIQSGTLQFSTAAYSVGEGGASVLITVTRAGGSDGAVSVGYETANGTALAGSDYTSQSGTLNWAAGDAADKTFSVPVSEDTTYEGDETFGVSLNSPGGGATLGEPSTAVVTVNENESSPTLSVGDVVVAEPTSGITYAVFPVTLSVASAQTVTVNYETADGTANAPADYAASSGTLTFAAGQTSKSVAVIVNADALSDTPESFSLNLSSPSNAAVSDGTGLATITPPVGPGTVLISEFRLRGPGDPNSALSDLDRPVVMDTPGRKKKRPPTDTAESDETAQPSAADTVGPNAAPTPPETDEFVEIYNNTDADIIVTDAHPESCALQVITLGPTQACGWALVDLQGSASGNIPRFVIPAGTTIPARGHYLAASTGYSLSALAAPDQTYSPPLYSGGEADYTGLALFKTADRAKFTQSNVFDAVGFEGVDSLFREGTGLLPAAGVSEDVQFSFVRNQTASRPSDTGDNRADFTLVATTPTLLYSGTATLGAPGPENRSSPVSRNSGFDVSLPPNVPSSSRNHTTVTNGSLGTLSLRRRFTNNTGVTLSKLRFRVVQLTTYNSKQVFATQAELRLLDAQLTGLGGTGLLATKVEQPPNQSSGGGVNSGLLVSGSLTLAQSLGPGQSVDVEFLLGVMQSGSFQFVVVVEGAP